MIKKTVTFTNFEGNEETIDVYFHLTKLEWLKLETAVDGGLVNALENAIKSNDTKSTSKTIELLEKIMLTAYGEKDENGRFVKSQEAAVRFSTTDAFSELFYELAYDEQKAQEFFIGLIPKDMVEKVMTKMKDNDPSQLSVVENK